MLGIVQPYAHEDEAASYVCFMPRLRPIQLGLRRHGFRTVSLNPKRSLATEPVTVALDSSQIP
jgi:hypothetical protein